MDAAGNSNQCVFDVTVIGARGVKSNILAELVALRGTSTNRNDCWELDEAIEDMIDALGLNTPEAPPWVQDAHRTQLCGQHHSQPGVGLWLDETHVDRCRGWWVFENEKDAVSELVEILNYRRSAIPDATAQDLINRLVACDRLLAVVSIQDAAKAGANTNKLAKILREVAEGDQDAAAHRPVEAVEDYWNAWTQVGGLHAAGIVSTGGGQMQMRFPGTAGKVYQVQASGNLLDWQTVGTATADSEGDVHFTDSDAAKHPAQFYRVVAQ